MGFALLRGKRDRRASAGGRNVRVFIRGNRVGSASCCTKSRSGDRCHAIVLHNLTAEGPGVRRQSDADVADLDQAWLGGGEIEA